jgi:hypothetical protein
LAAALVKFSVFLTHFSSEENPTWTLIFEVSNHLALSLGDKRI